MRSKHINIIILILVDMAVVVFSSIMPLALRFGIFTIFQQDIPFMDSAMQSLPADILITLAVMSIFKLYTRIWTFAGIDELLLVLKASLVIEALYAAYRIILSVPTPRSFYVFNWVFLFLLLAGSRVSVRLLKQLKKRYRHTEEKRNVMIVGAGAAASVLIKEIRQNDQRYQAICAIDDNPNKKGNYILNVPIVGDRKEIPSIVRRYRIAEIIIAMPSASPRDLREIITICNRTSARLKILPAIATGLTSSYRNEVREVNYEDLLGREAVVINNQALESFVNGKTVMVTGGGGSIGSELCKQIAANHPAKLVIVDIYENNVYELQMELKRDFPEVDLITLIASVTDFRRMEKIFAAYQPHIVYHAAAHKHVPLMEDSPGEAIVNNCQGTLNMVKLADRYQTQRFVLISTDKAVRPTNVMGATKRICEMLIQTYNQRSQTEFVAVRFGNVLGSNGSVVPVFLKQIEEGGPVTLTHKEVIRFFMTVSEAVALVLQAGLLAKGGEIFVLDMGQPVKIYDLAVNLIRLKGYVPEEEIQIEITGLRPGEKLYEELLMEEEGLQSTPNDLIYIGQPIAMDCEQFLTRLDRLITVAQEQPEGIRGALKDICVTYTPQRGVL